MSSRNTRLIPDDRIKARTISKALCYIKEKLKAGNTTQIKDEAKAMLLQEGFLIDYIEIADADTLGSVENWNGKQKVVVLTAAILANVRLIDNMVINTSIFL